MRGVAKVYLETSFISACVSTREDGESESRRIHSRTWWTLQRKLHQLFVSPAVIAELSTPTYPNSAFALRLTVGLPSLPLNEDVFSLATLLVGERVMPGPVGTGDAVHVAAATVHRIEYMISWNVRHLANVNKVAHLKTVCARVGMSPPTIVTPDALWPEDEAGE
jgi:hypothetical protein